MKALKGSNVKSQGGEPQVTNASGTAVGEDNHAFGLKFDTP